MPRRKVPSCSFFPQARVVAIKFVEKSSVDVRDRDILLELKHVRELSHENVNQFVGACVDAPNICVLMLYASKGSLQDVLQNENINLSMDFKISFAADVAKVRPYLPTFCTSSALVQLFVASEGCMHTHRNYRLRTPIVLLAVSVF